MRPARIAALLLLASMFGWSEATASDFLGADADGWYTWRLDTADAITEACCFTWEHSGRSGKGCHLDGRKISFGGRGDCAEASGHVQFYAFLQDGRPLRIRVLSSACPVSTETEIRNVGIVSADDTVAWFRGIIEDRGIDRDLREEALFGLVQSASDAAYTYIDQILSRR